MVQGKPYRYGLIVAGFCVTAVGLFILIQERPHVYGTMCVLGIIMVVVGTVWSLCQCYPQVILAPVTQDKSLEELACAATEAQNERPTEALLSSSGHKQNSGLLQSQRHSCPALHLV